LKFETSKLKGWLIGDPHLGKDFRNGTPLHRRGEREAMQLAQFKEELTPDDTNMIVCIGDLFDKPFVPLPVIHSAVDIVVSSAKAFPDVHYVFLAGNHDKSRQLGIRGAWELFELAVAWVPNITILNEPEVIDGVAFYPWEWDRTALEQVLSEPAEAACGHWDLKSFGGDDSHICPTVDLVRAHGEHVQIYSGHYHEEGDFTISGITVYCCGSLQPYAHGEGDMYVTLTAQEAIERDDLHDKCVRILLEPGEDLPEIDCLQLTYKRVDSEHEEVMGIEVGIGAFNLNETLADEFRENEVPEPVQSFIKERVGAFG
jgi:hypothetical protein